MLEADYYYKVVSFLVLLSTAETLIQARIKDMPFSHEKRKKRKKKTCIKWLLK